MEAVEWSLELEEKPTLALTPRLLAVCLALAVFGLLTAILLLIGVRTSIRKTWRSQRGVLRGEFWRGERMLDLGGKRCHQLKKANRRVW